MVSSGWSASNEPDPTMITFEDLWVRSRDISANCAGSRPSIVWSRGRNNLLGGHQEYQTGLEHGFGSQRLQNEVVGPNSLVDFS